MIEIEEIDVKNFDDAETSIRTKQSGSTASKESPVLGLLGDRE